MFVTKEGEEEEEFSSADPNYFLTDLESGIRYTFSIESVGALDRLSARRTESVTQQTITEPAQRFRVTSTKADLISLEWDPVVGELEKFLSSSTEMRVSFFCARYVLL